jgi:hypothetical protein
MSEMKILLRVFPRRTSYTPDGDLVFIGFPPFRGLIPRHDEVHVSCTFTWDIAYCKTLRDAWAEATDRPVKLGGVAFESPCADFTPGLYVREGITFTTRGCDNRCPFCVVPRVEGALRELPIMPGNIIQDNNFLQASRTHKDKVFNMLRSQTRIEFRGGLQASLIDAHFVDNIQRLRIANLWLACDSPSALKTTVAAIERLRKAGFSRRKISCYILIGDDMDENENRCREIYRAGAMPRAQLYRDFTPKKTEYSKAWRDFERMWQRPAATAAHMDAADGRRINENVYGGTMGGI